MSADGSNGSDNKWIGKRTNRPDGEDKVTGRAAFAADFSQPGMLIGKVLRSPHPHALIRSINTAKAAALPGVKAVMTGRDLDGVSVGQAGAPRHPGHALHQPQRDGAREGAVRRPRGGGGCGHVGKHRGGGPQADRGRLRGPALGHRRRRGAAAGRTHPARAHARRRRQAGSGNDIEHRGHARAQAGRLSTPGLPPPTSSSSAASRPSPCIKDTSSRTPASSASARTATPPSGAAARATSWCAT